jgi:hypothetical protein
VYSSAQNVERAITQTYNKMQALKAAAILGQSPTLAAKTGAISTPERPNLTGTKQGKASDSLKQAEGELAAMNARAQRLLTQANDNKGIEVASSDAHNGKKSGGGQDKTGKAPDGKKENLEGGGIAGEQEKKDFAYPVTDSPVGEIGEVAPAVPNLNAEKVSLGHRLSQSKAEVGGANTGKWMFLDSWYFLGPFDNPNRSNLHKAFGPEAGVDLDATYTGKNGKRLQWTFRQSNSARIKPPNAQEYAIWYAYCEVYAAQEEKVWVAIGSDDQSSLYVNGKLLWESQAVLKGWQPGEGLQQVTLHKGKNAFLFRLENGWRGVDMSVGIRLH